jgi:tRNA (pseudouridine54-N1)-methyltransferase|tara:strand:+ start:160 stop:750 length:591 start_codon:yes stop_codon:yes gene_type:complete
MRHFVYFSTKAPTSGKFSLDNLAKAGRLDIVIHSIIAGFFLSNDFREDVKMHLIFYGPPNPPRHIEIQVTNELEISKKDIGNLIKKILYKYKPGFKTEVLPGCFVEKKSLLKVITELEEQGKEIFILDKKGENIRKIKIPEESVFILGDHEGLPKKELKRLKQIANPVSVGPKVYFASQVVSVINNELDIREFISQ